MQAVEELAEWNGQSPPTASHQRGKPITPKIKHVIGKVDAYTENCTIHVYVHCIHMIMWLTIGFVTVMGNSKMYSM